MSEYTDVAEGKTWTTVFVIDVVHCDTLQIACKMMLYFSIQSVDTFLVSSCMLCACLICRV